MSQPTTTEALDALENCDDLISWINETLAFRDEDDPQATVTNNLSELDQRLTHLLASLDIACEDTSAQLERSIDDASRGVPRVIYDLHFIKDGAVSLQSSLSLVHARSLAAISDTTGVALEQLKRLDMIKVHMEAAREVLREAESWSTLELEVTSLLTERHYAKAASRLSEANKSMVVFQNTPEYDPRRTLLVNLQNQLEASLSSALVAAINKQDLATCRSYFSIFSNIQRELEFRNYYYGSRRSSLVLLWQDAELTEMNPEATSASQAAQSFSEFLPKFYASMLTILNQERTSIPAVFPDPAQTLSSFISSILSSLQPTFSERLASLYSYYNDLALKEIITVFRLTEEFAVGVEKIIEKIKYSAVPPTPIENSASPDPPNAPAHSRRRSMRMSMSFRTGPKRSTSGAFANAAKVSSVMDGLDWDQELFQPFLEFQVDYPSLERRLLDHRLREIISNDGSEHISSSLDQARLLRERAVDVFGVAEESLSRYIAFTHGYGAVGLLQALDGFLKSFLDMWTADINFASSTPLSAVGTTASEDLTGLDYSSQDWSKFQTTSHLLGSARSVFERLSAFDMKLRSSLSHTGNAFRLYRGDPVNFPITSSKGAGQILEQSSLNSAELHALLDKVDSDPTHSRDSFSSSNSGLRHSQVSVGEPLLNGSRASVFAFAQACQISLQGTILSPLRKHLALYASSSIWSVSDTTSPNTTFNDLQVPTFSLSPSDIIQRVTEGLLNLPRLFEVYADDDALSFSLQTLPHVDAELLKGLPEQSSLSSETMPAHSRRQSITNTKAISLDPETVSAAWLSSLGHSLLAHLTTDVLPHISKLTVRGAAQLASDLGWLSNVIRAINVEFEELEKWKEYVEMDDERGRTKVKEIEDGDRILEQVARMRGWR